MSIFDVFGSIFAAANDVVDLYLIQSDLVDIPLTEDELSETAYFDTLARHTADGYSGDSDVPIGKLVL